MRSENRERKNGNGVITQFLHNPSLQYDQLITNSNRLTESTNN